MTRMLEALRRIETRPKDPDVSETAVRPRHVAPPPEDVSAAAEAAEATASVAVLEEALEPAAEPATEPDPPLAAEPPQTAVLEAPEPEPATAPEPPQTVPPKARARVRRLDSQFVDLAGRVLGRLPPGRASVVALAGVGEVSAASVAASLGAAIVGRVTGEVVVVDGDFRQPSLAERLGVLTGKKDRTLLDVLRTGAGWRNLVRPTGIPRLGVVPGGRLSLHSAKPAGQSRLGPLLDELRRECQLVLLDAGPLAETEAAAATRFCDGTFLLAALGRTGRREARDAVRQIERAGGTVWGAILVDLQ